MTAMVTGGVIPIVIRRVIHITDNVLMFSCSIDMAVKCSHRPVSSGADDEPYHENAFEHNESLHHINSVFEKIGDYRISFTCQYLTINSPCSGILFPEFRLRYTRYCSTLMRKRPWLRASAQWLP
jgi:hypothetical protein